MRARRRAQPSLADEDRADKGENARRCADLGRGGARRATIARRFGARASPVAEQNRAERNRAKTRGDHASRANLTFDAAPDQEPDGGRSLRPSFALDPIPPPGRTASNDRNPPFYDIPLARRVSDFDP
jgi:hypothetical protein